MAKLLASEAAWAAADTCIQTHGGYGFSVEYDVEVIDGHSRWHPIDGSTAGMDTDADAALLPGRSHRGRSGLQSFYGWHPQQSHQPFRLDLDFRLIYSGTDSQRAGNIPADAIW